MSVRSGLSKLYNGETDLQIVPRWKLWFVLSAVLIAIGVAGLLGRGLNLGIDFEGGVSWEVPAGEASVADVESALAGTGIEVSRVQSLDSSSGRIIRVQASEVDTEQRGEVITVLTEVTGVDRNEVSFNEVGPSWGDEISEKAVRALVIFLVLVSLYIAVRFEWKMALATLAALLHDILITVGVYSVLNLSVTPATVIAFLTILGYSIYDGIVVFDRVDENASKAASGDETYSAIVNRSLNEVLMRTLNTTITALLPIGALIVIGSRVMGATALEEFALALFVGLLSGAYSSLFIASPLLALLKEREAKWTALRRRVEGRGITPPRERLQPSGGVTGTSTALLERETTGEETPDGPRERRPATGPVIQPRGRKKGRRR